MNVTLIASPSARYSCKDTPYWSFTSWSGDASGTNATTIVALNADKNVVANFGEFFPPPCPTPTPTIPPPTYRVNAGNAATLYTDSKGNVWAKDKLFAIGSWGFTTGSAKSSSSAVAGTLDDPLYQKYREKPGEYKFTVPNGNYQVTLKFAEFAVSNATARKMKITIEGVVVDPASVSMAWSARIPPSTARTQSRSTMASSILSSPEAPASAKTPSSRRLRCAATDSHRRIWRFCLLKRRSHSLRVRASLFYKGHEAMERKRRRPSQWRVAGDDASQARAISVVGRREQTSSSIANQRLVAKGA